MTKEPTMHQTEVLARLIQGTQPSIMPSARDLMLRRGWIEEVAPRTKREARTGRPFKVRQFAVTADGRAAYEASPLREAADRNTVRPEHRKDVRVCIAPSR